VSELRDFESSFVILQGSVMADIFLILVIVVASLLFLVASVYFLIHYQHPEDRNTAYFSKLVILGAFMLSGFAILGLPLDVANNAGYAGTCRSWSYLLLQTSMTYL
jgi:LMBR1-like membrane protein